MLIVTLTKHVRVSFAKYDPCGIPCFIVLAIWINLLPSMTLVVSHVLLYSQSGLYSTSPIILMVGVQIVVLIATLACTSIFCNDCILKLFSITSSTAACKRASVKSLQPPTTGVACNYVLYAILSGGHYVIMSAGRFCICNRVRPDATNNAIVSSRTHLHVQLCPPPCKTVLTVNKMEHVRHLVHVMMTWEMFGRWVFYSLQS